MSFLQQSFFSAPPGTVDGGEAFQSLDIDEPRIVNFRGRQITLATQPLYRLGMNFQTAAGFNHGKVVV
jgi:hypothetical protein